MTQNLEDIAKKLSTPVTTTTIKSTETRPIEPKEVQKTKPVPKIQLIYAFNGTGKTRLSREMKDLIAPTSDDEDGSLARQKYLYYSAFTEDLFYWKNDLDLDEDRKMVIQPNSFTDWILRDRGQETNIVTNFQRYTSESITPSFPPEVKVERQGDRSIRTQTHPEVRFSYRGGETLTENIKISKGEESNLIWSIFYTLLQEVIAGKQDGEDDEFNELEYIFIDDPVSSLDDSHLIELAVDLAGLIKSSVSDLKFVITTHNPLFYNVLFNELGNSLDVEVAGENKRIYSAKQSKKYRLTKHEDGTFELDEQSDDHPFSYHLFLLEELRKAVETNDIKKYHFSFLRNILEKTATFLGHKKWAYLLPKIDGDPDPFANRLANLASHSAHSGEEVAELDTNDKEKLGELVNYLFSHYHFFKPKDQDA